jgi:hypothetical protein
MTDDVTKFWDALRAKWPVPVRPLHNIQLQEQLMLIEAINIVLRTLQNNEGNK